MLIGDRFPGARDEYGRPQEILAPVFGVRKVVEEEEGGTTAKGRVAVRHTVPLIGLRLKGLEQGDANLRHVPPAAAFSIEATAHNPSDQPLPSGDARLYLPRGWFRKAGTIAIDAIPPWESRSATFQVKSPPVCGDRRLRPLVVKYAAGSRQSTSATALVWWSRGTDRTDGGWR